MDGGVILLAILVLVSFDDGEGLRVFVVLHHEPVLRQLTHLFSTFHKVCVPVKTLFILAVDLTRLLQLLGQLLHAVGFGVHVHDERVGGHC